MTFIGDADDPATVLEDARKFFFKSDYFAASDDEQASGIEASFSESNSLRAYWGIGALTSALVQVYDLVAPLDVELAEVLINRLGRIAGALLASRDDYRGFPADAFRGRVMPAWGACTKDRDCKWNTDVDTSGLFAYAMAAFARRAQSDASRAARC